MIALPSVRNINLYTDPQVESLLLQDIQGRVHRVIEGPGGGNGAHRRVLIGGEYTGARAATQATPLGVQPSTINHR